MTLKKLYKLFIGLFISLLSYCSSALDDLSMRGVCDFEEPGMPNVDSANRQIRSRMPPLCQ